MKLNRNRQKTLGFAPQSKLQAGNNLMTHSIEEITAKVSALPEPMQQEVFDFVEFMQAKVSRQKLSSSHEAALLSEQALATDWNRSEEDEAWMTIDDTELKPANKRRTPPQQFAGQVKELDDVMTFIPAVDKGLN
jgi:hypothetical protein